MNILLPFIDFVLHIDRYLQGIVNEYAALAYLFLFLIIFFETGIVVTPFLPGDSLLFAAGALAAMGSFNIALLYVVIFIAAVLGDTMNYHIGRYIGPKVFTREKSLLFRKDHLLRAQLFYETYGKKAIVIARFIPIIRTFAPFVAGIGAMSYRVFIFYNVLGALAWCGLFIFGGYLFGNIPAVRERFGVLVIAIIVLSLLPIVKEMGVHFLRRNKQIEHPLDR